jgi:hypothetical protein
MKAETICCIFQLGAAFAFIDFVLWRWWCYRRTMRGYHKMAELIGRQIDDEFNS